MSESERAIADRAASLAVDYWKLLRTCERMISSLPLDKSTRLGAQARYSAGRLEQHLGDLGLQLLTYEGQPFGPELPAVAVNSEEIDGHEGLVIESAVEPAVISDGRVIQTARVIVKEGIADVSGD